MTTSTMDTQVTASAWGLKKITLTLLDINERPIKKSLIGRWIVGDRSAGLVDSAPPSNSLLDTGVQYSVALTSSNSLVVYRTHKAGLRFPEMFEHRDLADLKQFKYLDRLSNVYLPYPPNVLVAIENALQAKSQPSH